MRIISFLRFITSFYILYLSAVSNVHCSRVRKASRNALNQVKALIDQQVEREFTSSPIGIQADVSQTTRKSNDSLPQHNELSVNNPEDYYQGDIDLLEEQVELLKNSLQSDKGPKKSDNDKFAARTKSLCVNNLESKGQSEKLRKVGRAPFYKLWDITRPISYDFDRSIPRTVRQKIREAVAIWESNTCVRFRENGQNIDRIEFFDGGGCSSFVGRAGGTQGISIGIGCDFIGIITHEIGHALGIFHEQARPDQRDYIFVNFNNIAIDRWNNFQAVPRDQMELYGLPYDTGSVMHYGAYGFANDPYVPTITTRDRYQQQTIGQREGPSFLDFQAINLAYRCLERCPRRYCEHNGFVNPNNCFMCLCPHGLGGENCETVQPSPCSNTIKVSPEVIYISNPSFPGYSPPDEKCFWLLEAPKGGRIFLQFTDYFQLECQDTCDRSYIELKLEADFRITGYRFCCSIKPQHIFESATNKMIVIYKSSHGHRGFKARVWSSMGYLPESTSALPETLATSSTTKETSLPTTTPELTTTTTEQTTMTTKPITTTESTTTIEPTITTEPSTTIEQTSLTKATSEETTYFSIGLKRHTIASTIVTTGPITESTYMTKKPLQTSLRSSIRPIITVDVTRETVATTESFRSTPSSSSTTERITSTKKITAPPLVFHKILRTSTPRITKSSSKISRKLLTTTPLPSCDCGEWSSWVSTCSQQCGGCGKRSRIRHCASSDCRTEDKRTCNYHACPSGTNFLINNGEFHILWKGCCVGLFISNGECAPLENNQNPFLTFLASLFTSMNPKQRIKGKPARHRIED